MSDSYDPIDYSLPSSSVHGILQAGIPEWVAIFISIGSSPPRDGTQVSDIARVIGDSLKVGEESTCNAGDLGWGDPLEELATHASLLACRISRTEKLVRLQPMWSYNLATTPSPPGKPQAAHLGGDSPVSPGHRRATRLPPPGILCG